MVHVTKIQCLNVLVSENANFSFDTLGLKLCMLDRNFKPNSLEQNNNVDCSVIDRTRLINASLFDYLHEQN